MQIQEEEDPFRRRLRQLLPRVDPEVIEAQKQRDRMSLSKFTYPMDYQFICDIYSNECQRNQTKTSYHL